MLKIGSFKLNINKSAIVLFFIASFFQVHILTMNTLLCSVFKYLGMVLAVLGYFWKKTICFKRFFLQLFVILCMFYTSIVTSNFSYLLILLIIISARNLTIEEYIIMFYKCVTIELVVAFILWSVNFFVDISIPIFYDLTTGEYRIAFGLSHPNMTAVLVIWWGIAYCIIKRKKYNVTNVIHSITIGVFGTVTTQSSAFIFYFLFVLLFLLRNIYIIRKIMIKISKYIFIISGISVYILQKWFGMMEGSLKSMIAYKFDIISNYRLSMSFLAEKLNDITLLGQKIVTTHNWGDDNIPYGNFTVDTLYTYLFVGMGIVYFIIISIAFYKLAEYKNYYIALVVIIFSLYSLVELHSMYLTNSFALIFLKPLFFGEKDITI